MLGGEPGQGLGAEVSELVDCLLRSVQSLPELGVLRLEAGDLGFARVGNVAGLLQGLKASLELDAEVRVRPAGIRQEVVAGFGSPR
ncbi:hypothetical protein ABT126_39795 [Streptomyces sp. NPDC002012]|uniref:hypothetical protein n=1 Tax=unclassified Streptomyces TaxID=2593676 RepID=UPI00332E6566